MNLDLAAKGKGGWAVGTYGEAQTKAGGKEVGKNANAAVWWLKERPGPMQGEV